MTAVAHLARPAELPASFHRSMLAATVSVALASMALSAQAQQPAAAAPAPAASEPESVQSVTVTANRRREPAREVPMQVNVLSAEQLSQSGARSLSDYLANQPGIDVKTAGGAGLGAVNIRGVSTGDQTVSTVGTYIDDVAFGSSSAFLLGQTTALDMALLDLNHVELLRGPQGTLYGAGAMGGLLKYVTNEPDTGDFSGKISLGTSFTQAGAWSNVVNGVVNIPLKQDVAAVRVSAFREHEGGFVDAIGPAARKDANHGDTTGGRVAVLFEPTSRFHVRLTGTAQEIKRQGNDYVDYDATTGRPVHGELTRELVVSEPYTMRTGLASADLEYDFGWARLNSVTSVQESKLKERLDYSLVYGPLLLQLAGLDLATVPLDLYSNVRKTTQEFRLTSKGGGEIEWLAGLYYDREHGTNGQLVSSTMTAGGPGPDLVTGTLPSDYRETAAYGDVTWNATSRLSLTGGARIAQNRQHYTQMTDGPLVGGPTDNPGHSQETSKTWLATGRYALTSTSNAYLRAASGYRPGGPNAVVVGSGAPSSFKHDSLWSYEAGYKADLLDKTLSVETSVYDIEWDNIQQFSAVNGIQVIVNAGKARIKGFEFASTWRPATNFSLDANLATIDGKLTEDAPGLGASGARLPNSARFSASAGARYSFSNAGNAAFLGAHERFVGERNAGFDGSSTLPNYKLPSYWMTDLTAGVSFQKFDLSLYLRNAFNEHAQLSASTSFVPLGGAVLVTPAQPRTAGVALTANF